MANIAEGHVEKLIRDFDVHYFEPARQAQGRPKSAQPCQKTLGCFAIVSFPDANGRSQDCKFFRDGLGMAAG